MHDGPTRDGLAGLSLPEVVPHETWLRARTELLEREKALTRARDALSADRRRLPMVEVTTDYRFDGPSGEVGLLDLTALGRQEPWEEPKGRTTGLALQAGSPTMPCPDEYPDA